MGLSSAQWTAVEFGPTADSFSIVRLSGPNGQLTGPTLIGGRSGALGQLKILHGEQPMLFLAEFDEADLAAAKDMFVKTAKMLNESGETFATVDEARAGAAKCLRKLLLA